MYFKTFSQSLQEIENLDSRLSMTEALANLFKQSNPEEVDKLCYLSLGQLAPKFANLEFNLAEKMIVRTISYVLNTPVKDIASHYRELGDLGEVIYTQLKQHPDKTKDQKLSVQEVFKRLVKVANEEGQGSQERKLQGMTDLIKDVDPLSAKYLVRIPIKKLRLGFSDMTILDALSWSVTSDKSLRKPLEAAFNVRADIGEIAQVFLAGGIKGIENLNPTPGVPIRPAKASPLTDTEDILKKMQGQTALEAKYDGFRVQIHINKNPDVGEAKELNLFSNKDNLVEVNIYSRNLDNITHMFPELVEAATKLPVTTAILDGEAVAVDLKTGALLDFQETIKRKRKHDIKKVAKDIPLRAYIFDLLYLDGKTLLDKPLSQRQIALEQLFQKTTTAVKKHLQKTPQLIVKNSQDFQKFFQKMADQNLEGVMAKKIGARYRAGARDFTWVKYKVGMQSELADTVDAVVMGYFKGKGKWTKFGMGKILIGIPSKTGEILSLSKVGSGFSEKLIKEMVARCKKLEVAKKPKNYHVDKQLEPDIWIVPEMVIEIRADSVSRSPIYTTGLSLRFPRFIRFRDDKSPQDATSKEELQKMIKLITK